MTVIADSTVRSMCTIGQEISIWCEKNHITNQELADALAVSRETVKRIKNGTRELTSKEIRKLSADVPIIAITAFAYASDEQRVLENGFDGYMSKPINAPLLKQQIASILQKRIIFL